MGRSTHETAGVDVEGLAGDGFVFGEEDGDAGDFVGRANGLGRNLVANFLGDAGAMSVSINPGAMALAVIPSLANWEPSERVRPRMPALEAA